MSSVLLCGAGAVGARAARQLVETAGVDRLLVTDADVKRRDAVVAAMGTKAAALDLTVDLAAALKGVDAIAAAAPAGADIVAARAAIARGIPFATACDDVVGLQGVLALDAGARTAGVTLAVGAGLAPGLSDVLARHAADTFDTLEEVNIARYGVAGPASQSTARRALRERAVEVRDGRRSEVKRRGGKELVWFPDPVGARECEQVGTCIDLLVRAFPDAKRLTARQVEPERRTRLSLPGREDPEGSWGALRVEAWGARGAGREPLVYGAIERTAIAAGTVLAVTTAALLGALPGVLDLLPGAHGLAELANPRAFLDELSRRGVRAAVFEGVPVS